jgi:hypothetical protein
MPEHLGGDAGSVGYEEGTSSGGVWHGRSMVLRRNNLSGTIAPFLHPAPRFVVTGE